MTTVTTSAATTGAARRAKTPARVARRRSSTRAGGPARLLLNLAAALTFVFATFPVYWMVKASLTPNALLGSANDDGRPSLLPWPVTFEHYRKSFSPAANEQSLGDALWRSGVVALCTVLASLLVAFLAATALARFRFRGRTFYLIALMAVQMIPLEALAIPMYMTLRDAHALNMLPSLIAVYISFVLPFTIWTLRSFIASIPVDLEEAAMMDGCSRFSAFWRVLFPLIMPGLVATAIFSFIQAWNEFLYALVLTDSGQGTLPVWLGNFVGKEGTDWGGIMAGSSLFTLPVVLLFILIHKRITTGMAAGAVKG
jgi:N,N'-diacetylchitobiose transport system permease protein